MKIFIASLAMSLAAFLMYSHFANAGELSRFYQCEGYQSVRIKKLRTGHDVISAELNGVNAQFVLDTGTKFSVIDERYLEKYKLDHQAVLKEEKSAGAAGEILIKSYALKSLRVKSRALKVSTIGVTNLSQVINGLGRSTGVWVDGIIGQDLLLTHFGIVDNRKKRLYIKPKIEDVSSCDDGLAYQQVLIEQGYQATPLTILSMDLATVEMVINGQRGEFILDSGAPAVILNNESLAKFHLDNTSVTGSRSSSGAGGAITLKTMALGSVQIGSSTYALESVSALDLSAVVKHVEALSGSETYGVIGQDLLQNFSSIISFHDNTLYLKP